MKKYTATLKNGLTDEVIAVISADTTISIKQQASKILNQKHNTYDVMEIKNNDSAEIETLYRDNKHLVPISGLKDADSSWENGKWNKNPSYKFLSAREMHKRSEGQTR